MKRAQLLFIIFLAALFLLGACSEDSTSTEPDNAEPGIPSNPDPENNSIDVSLTPSLAWECIDPEGDALSYDVYFGASVDPALANTGQNITTYDPGILFEETTYFWKINAHDDHSNSTTGDIWQFTTLSGGSGTVTDIDGNVYETLVIGSQIWMTENLKVTHYRNGDPIPNITNDDAWSDLTTGAYVWYDNNVSWKDSYGAMYNWFAVDNARGLAPAGWHVPTVDEWTILTDYIGGIDSPHGNELKSCRQVNSPLGGECNTDEHPRWSQDDNNWGSDDYGFSALPGGYRHSSGEFYTIGNYGYWWSSTDLSSEYAWNRRLDYNAGNVTPATYTKVNGSSVRCIKDADQDEGTSINTIFTTFHAEYAKKDAEMQ